MSTDTFRGRLGDQTYTDPALFSLDVKAAAKAGRSTYLGEKDGYMPMKLQPLASGRLNRGRTPAQMTVLTPAEREWLGVYVKTLGRAPRAGLGHPPDARLPLGGAGGQRPFAVHKSACTGIRGAEAEPLDVTA